MAGIINSAIRTRAKPPRPLSIRDILWAERLGLELSCTLHNVLLALVGLVTSYSWTIVLARKSSFVVFFTWGVEEGGEGVNS